MQLKQQMQLAAVKSDCSLLSRLYIACQSRDGDLDQFFSHENQAAPPALSTGGKLRLAVKADLLHCLKSDQTETTCPLVVDATILHGAAIVQMLNPVAAKTFQEYVNIIFAPYISTQLQKVHRLDFVWDVYLPDSLNGTTRQKRGKGLRKRTALSTVMPKNWKDFLRVDQNKTELFGFLSREAIRLPIADGNEMYATCGTEVLCSPAESDLTSLAPCSHEEADTRMLLHVADVVQKGTRKVSGVVVLAVASFHSINPDELWLALGTGSSFRHIAVR